MRTITLEEFKAQLVAQAVGTHEHFAFVCPMCKTIQSGTSLIRAGAGKTFDDIERYLAFSCVGRWTNAGPKKRGEPPGRGCDWTLGGLFRLHTLEVRDDDGTMHPRFEIASPAEALALKARHHQQNESAQGLEA